jgi:hypothetical protein
MPSTNSIPVFIIMHDLYTWPRLMAEHIAQLPGARPIFVDNASTYPLLLEYYETCPFEVIRLPQNIGHHAPWDAFLIESRTDDLYVVTDPDLDISSVPLDVLVRLEAGLKSHPTVSKAGLSIEINDIPLDYVKREQVLEWETPFWSRPLPDGRWYDAPIDTTFAMYSIHKGWPGGFLGAVRAERPYTVRHLPFYLTRENVSDEYRYYMEHASVVSSSSQYLRGVL